MLSEQFNQLIQDYRTPLFLLICLLAQYLGWRLWRRRVSSRAGRGLVGAAFLLFNLGWFFTVAALYLGPDLTDRTWSWVGRPSFAWQLLYLLVILPLGVLGALAGGLFGRLLRLVRRPADRVDRDRRDFLKTAGTAGGLTVLGLGGYGVFRQGRPPGLRRLTIAIPGLPPALDGLVIAHLTDPHLGLWSSQAELDLALELAAAEKPDLVVFTGDLVDRKADFARLYHRPLQRLASTPHGVWGVLGNHDHYTLEPYRVADLLTAGGLTMLVDRRVNLPEIPITLIGLDDQGVHHNWMGNGGSAAPGDETEVLDFDLVRGPEARPGDLVILLNHRPEGFRQAAGRGCRLYLAGHTHGGQYQFPGRDQWNLAAAFYKYSSGLYHEYGCWLNVSRGLAAVGVPFRLFAWPEIDFLTLRSK